MQSSRQNLSNGMARLCLVIPFLILGLHPPAGALDLSAGPWVYLREGTPPASDERLVAVIAVGDVMPGRGPAGGARRPASGARAPGRARDRWPEDRFPGLERNPLRKRCRFARRPARR